MLVKSYSTHQTNKKQRVWERAKCLTVLELAAQSSIHVSAGAIIISLQFLSFNANISFGQPLTLLIYSFAHLIGTFYAVLTLATYLLYSIFGLGHVKLSCSCGFMVFQNTSILRNGQITKAS